MRIWNKKTFDFAAILLLLFIASMYYLKVFESGIKTSVNVKAWGMSLLITGVIISFLRRNDLKKHKIEAIVLIALLVILGINILLFDYLNIVVNYEDWIKRRI